MMLLPGRPLGCPEGPQPLGNNSPLCASVRYMGLIPAGRGPASSLPHRSRTASNTREARAVPGRSLLPPPQGRAEARTRPGRGSLAAHQPGAAALRRPAHTARHQGQQPRPAARHRCPSRSSARQGAPATPVLAGEGRSSGPRCQICRSCCGLHHAPRPAAARFAPPLRPLPPAAGLCGSGALHPAARSKVPGGLWGRAAARLSTRPGLSGARRPPGRLGLAYARRSGRRAWLGHAAALAQARRLGSCCPCVRLGGGPARSI